MTTQKPFHFFAALAICLMVALISVPDTMAERIFYDSFEDPSFTEKAFTISRGSPQWEPSEEYNHTPGGGQCLRFLPQIGGRSLLSLNDFLEPIPKPARVRIWFYDRGWDNKVKVDQAYLFADDVVPGSFGWQIGQTGHPDWDGHYAVWARLDDWHVSKTASTGARWVKFEFVFSEDGTVKFLIDDFEERTFQARQEVMAFVGFLGIANAFGNRGGVTDSYWDDLEIFDSDEEPPPLEAVGTAVDPQNKMAVTWGQIKMDR